MMRDYFQEGDLISVSCACGVYTTSVAEGGRRGGFEGRSWLVCVAQSCCCVICCCLQAEVQMVHSDGALSLHTRSLKYGKVSCLCAL